MLHQRYINVFRNLWNRHCPDWNKFAVYQNDWKRRVLFCNKLFDILWNFLIQSNKLENDLLTVFLSKSLFECRKCKGELFLFEALFKTACSILITRERTARAVSEPDNGNCPG